MEQRMLIVRRKRGLGAPKYIYVAIPIGPTHHPGTKQHNHIGSVRLHDVTFLEQMPNFQGALGMPPSCLP